jgi:hypothetical protein
VSRRFSAIALLFAWLCASGAMLDLVQVTAWTRMFAGYAGTESFAAAARETFDPCKPCNLCRAVSHARDASRQHGPAVPSSGGERLILIFERSPVFVASFAEQAWPDARPARALRLSGEVPVPPPRGLAPIALN